MYGCCAHASRTNFIKIIIRFYLIAGTLRVYSLSSTGSSSEKSMEYAAEFSLYIYLLCGRSVPNYEYITFRKKTSGEGKRKGKKSPSE